MKVVVIISANGEWNAVRSLLSNGVSADSLLGTYFETQYGGRDLIFFHGGWGKVSAAATAQYVIDHFAPDLIVNLGTCGGFEGRIQIGTIILADKTIIYDIFEQMTDAETAIQHYSTQLDLDWLPLVAPTAVWRGLLVSADRDIVADQIPGLIARYDAVAADWESGAIAWVAKKNRKRLLILRGVSDLVGRAGGEAYGDYQLFLGRTQEILGQLLHALPDWLNAIEPNLANSA